MPSRNTVPLRNNQNAPLADYKETELDDIDDGLLPPSRGKDEGLIPGSGGIDDGLLDDLPGDDVPMKGDRNFPDVNIYQHKKTLAQGMMDLALLSANANQLRYVLERGTRHSYYYVSLTLISLSLFLQVAVGVGLIWNSKYNVHKNRQMHMANRVNNLTVIGIFIITVLNVFISAFGVPGADELEPLSEAISTNLTEKAT